MPNATMPGVGKRLRGARKDRQLSIEEVAWRTRIRPEYLRALEREHYGEIGHSAFVCTHLSSYARTLGLDPSQLVEEFRSTQNIAEPRPLEDLRQRERAVRRQRPRFRWVHAAAAAAIILIGAAAAGVLGHGSPKPVTVPVAGSAPRIERLEAASRGSVPRWDGQRPLGGGQPAVRLELEAASRVWVRVVVDGAKSFDGVMVPGATASFAGTEGIELWAGSGKGLRLRVDGAAFTLPDEGREGTSHATFAASSAR